MTSYQIMRESYNDEMIDAMENSINYGWTFAVCTDVIHIGRHPEDGHEVEGYATYIRAENEDGERFTMEMGQDRMTVEQTDDDYGDCYVQRHDYDDTEAKAIAADMNDGRYGSKRAAKRAGSSWERAAAAYGSMAHNEWDHMDSDDRAAARYC